VVLRGVIGSAAVCLGALALSRIWPPAGPLLVAAVLVHWLGLYPRWICLHCPHYGRVCPSWGGKVSALLYDRPSAADDPRRFGRRKRWGHLAGIGLRALPLVVLAVALAGPARHDAMLWAVAGALLLLAGAEGVLLRDRVCRDCRARAHCPARWTPTPTEGSLP
jgi:hypothetical protein